MGFSINKQFTDEYFSILQAHDGDVAGRRAAFGYMQDSTAIVHHEVVACTFIPRLFDHATYLRMKETAETAHRILCKVITRYLEDPSYREVFDYDPRLVELICLPRGYDSLLPIARLDVFLDEETGQAPFCEFNGDGSSGMNENREVHNSLRESATYREFCERHDVKGCELFTPWVEAFLHIYDTYEHKVENPRIAICDYLENGVVDEFRLYAEVFEEFGYDCQIIDVRDLRFDGERLLDKEGLPIHAIWRRCVTNDVLTYWDDSQALIEAVRAEKVALIGSFAGHIVHDKQIFEVLYKPETQAFLTAEEISFIEQHIPLTAFLDDDHVNVAQIRANKDEWIIKPTDHYGADQVFAGCACDQEKWEALIDRYANSGAGFPFIVQRYIRPFKTLTLPPDESILALADDEVKTAPELYNNLNGLYLYDGHFAGVFSRLGPMPTISKDTRGITAATLWVDCERLD